MNEGKLKNSRPPWVEAVITLPFFSLHPSLPRQTKFWQCCPPVAPTLYFLSIISLFLRHVPAHTCWLALSASWSLTLSGLEDPHWELFLKNQAVGGMWHRSCPRKNTSFGDLILRKLWIFTQKQCTNTEWWESFGGTNNVFWIDLNVISFILAKHLSLFVYQQLMTYLYVRW